MSDTKNDLCGFSGYQALARSAQRSGYSILGATRPPLKRVVPMPAAKSPAGAVANATAAAARAVTAGQAAVAASKQKPKQKRLTKVAGLGETQNAHLLGINERRSIFLGLGETSNEFLLADGSAILGGLGETQNAHLLPGMECLGLDERRAIFAYLDTLGVDSDEPGAAYAAEAAYEILGAAGASSATQALAARAAASSAALAAARAKAATAPEKIARANASVDKHDSKLADHGVKAEAAGARGAAALAQGKVASAAIAEQVARLKKMGLRTILGVEAASMSVPYDVMPGDAVPFPASRGWDRYSKGSYNYFYGTPEPDSWGMIWGWTAQVGAPQLPPAPNVDPNAPGPVGWVQRTGLGYTASALTKDSVFPVTNMNVDDKEAAKVSSSPGSRMNDPSGKTWGPLVGRPGTDYEGLRYSTGDGRWWWKQGEAPAWVQGPIDDAVALLAKQTEDANNAATAATAAKEEALRLQQEADAAALEARNALEDAALARAAQLQADQLQLADDANQAALKIQQDKDDAAAASAQSTRDTAQAVEDQRAEGVRTRQIETDRDQALRYAAAHPEEEYAAPRPGNTPARDEYGRGVADGSYGGGEDGGGARGAGSYSGSGNFDQSDADYQEGSDDRGLPFPGEE